MYIVASDRLLHVCLNCLSLGPDGINSFIVDCSKIVNIMHIRTFGIINQALCQIKMKKQTAKENRILSIKVVKSIKIK